MQVARPEVSAAPRRRAPELPLTAEALWVEFRDRLRGFVVRRVANAADADDIVQWVFLQMHRKLNDIRRHDRIHAWLYSTARRAISDYYRSGARRREVPAGDALDLDSLTPASPVERDVDGAREVAACLAPVVDRLSPADRQAIELTEVQGLRLLDAAAASGLSLSGMKSRVQRARRRLRQLMLDCCHIVLDARGTPMSCATRAPAAGPCFPKCD